MWGKAEWKKIWHDIYRMEGPKGRGPLIRGSQRGRGPGTDHSRNGFQMAQHFLFHKRPKARSPQALR